MSYGVKNFLEKIFFYFWGDSRIESIDRFFANLFDRVQERLPSFSWSRTCFNDRVSDLSNHIFEMLDNTKFVYTRPTVEEAISRFALRERYNRARL